MHFQSMTGPSRLSQNAQLAGNETIPQEYTVASEGLAQYLSQAVWIPDGDKTLQIRLCSISRQLSRYYHDTCEKCSFVALLDMGGVSNFMFWSGALVCLILQNHWWLNQIAISPKSLFFGVFSALCFRQ
jgi:hypothetical protein